MQLNLLAAHYPPKENQVIISRAAYYALYMMLEEVERTGKEWQDLPTISDSKNKANHVQELVKQKKICEERFIGKPARREIRLVVDFDRVKPSKTLSNKLPKEADRIFSIFDNTPINVTPTSGSSDLKIVAPLVKNNPVSVGGYKPIYYDLKDYIKAVDEWSYECHKETHENLTKSINAIKAKLPNVTGGEEEKLSQDLASLIQRRKMSGLETLLDAVKEIAADPKFRRFDFDEMLSKDPLDYFGR